MEILSAMNIWIYCELHNKKDPMSSVVVYWMKVQTCGPVVS